MEGTLCKIFLMQPIIGDTPPSVGTSWYNMCMCNSYSQVCPHSIEYDFELIHLN